MNDEQLHGYLRSIGKECFVRFFEEFRDFKQSDETVARRIAKDRNYAYPATLGCRVKPARKIISARRGRDALIICVQSNRLHRLVREKAAELAGSTG